jgi:hypothetical protein
MATVTRPYKPQATPAPVEAEARAAAPEAPVLDPMRPHFGDRIAFAIWITCALFMAALLTYDSVIGLFR